MFVTFVCLMVAFLSFGDTLSGKWRWNPTLMLVYYISSYLLANVITLAIRLWFSPKTEDLFLQTRRSLIQGRIGMFVGGIVCSILAVIVFALTGWIDNLLIGGFGFFSIASVFLGLPLVLGHALIWFSWMVGDHEVEGA